MLNSFPSICLKSSLNRGAAAAHPAGVDAVGSQSGGGVRAGANAGERLVLQQQPRAGHRPQDARPHPQHLMFGEFQVSKLDLGCCLELLMQHWMRAHNPSTWALATGANDAASAGFVPRCKRRCHGAAAITLTTLDKSTERARTMVPPQA